MLKEDYNEFISLVKRMREAQGEQEILSERVIYKKQRRIEVPADEYDNLASITNKVVKLEDEVDEYLKKMEI
jgi:hypothetical protein